LISVGVEEVDADEEDSVLSSVVFSCSFFDSTGFVFVIMMEGGGGRVADIAINNERVDSFKTQ
jgi:hypothetical protein